MKDTMNPYTGVVVRFKEGEARVFRGNWTSENKYLESFLRSYRLDPSVSGFPNYDWVIANAVARAFGGKVVPGGFVFDPDVIV
jgi:hypothetical protein